MLWAFVIAMGIWLWCMIGFWEAVERIDDRPIEDQFLEMIVCLFLGPAGVLWRMRQKGT